MKASSSGARNKYDNYANANGDDANKTETRFLMLCACIPPPAGTEHCCFFDRVIVRSEWLRKKKKMNGRKMQTSAKDHTDQSHMTSCEVFKLTRIQQQAASPAGSVVFYVSVGRQVEKVKDLRTDSMNESCERVNHVICRLVGALGRWMNIQYF